MNLICDRALLAGYVHNSRRITAGMVQQAAKEVEGERPRGPVRWHHGLVAAALTLLLAVLAFALAPRRAQAPDAATDLRETPTPPPAPTPTPAPAHSQRLDALVRELPRDASFAAAAAHVQSIWGRTPLLRAALRTQLDQLRAFDLPAALELSHPSRRDTCFAALVRLDERAAIVAIGDEPAARGAARAARRPLDPGRGRVVARGAGGRDRSRGPRARRSRAWDSASPT